MRNCNFLTHHTYQFVRYFFFLDAMRILPTFDPAKYLHERFFYEVFNSLAETRKRRADNDDVKDFRDVLRGSWLDEYCEIAGVERVWIPNMAASGQYIATDILTAFLNNVKNRMGDCVRRSINVAVNIDTRFSGWGTVSER